MFALKCDKQTTVRCSTGTNSNQTNQSRERRPQSKKGFKCTNVLHFKETGKENTWEHVFCLEMNLVNMFF